MYILVRCQNDETKGWVAFNSQWSDGIVTSRCGKTELWLQTDSLLIGTVLFSDGIGLSEFALRPVSLR